MKQTRTMSMIEAIANVAVGFWIAVATQALVFPIFGLHAAFRHRGDLHPCVAAALFCSSPGVREAAGQLFQGGDRRGDCSRQSTGWIFSHFEYGPADFAQETMPPPKGVWLSRTIRIGFELKIYSSLTYCLFQLGKAQGVSFCHNIVGPTKMEVLQNVPPIKGRLFCFSMWSDFRDVWLGHISLRAHFHR